LTYGDNVREPHDHGQDARSYHDLPEAHAKRTLTRGRLVQVPEDGNADDDHEEPKGDKAMVPAEQWPIRREIMSKDWEF
jgi:hypothetical protein